MGTIEKSFQQQLRASAHRANSIVCVGLDPVLDKMPTHLHSLEPAQAIIAFNRAIIDATADVAMAFKPNLGFYIAYGVAGLEALAETRRMIDRSIPVILDCKVGDFEYTAASYARGFLDEWEFDAVTASPYIGRESLQPFLGRAEKGAFVLCKTSNPGSGEFQDLTVQHTDRTNPLYITVAERVDAWNEDLPGTAGLVVGATWPEQLREVRTVAPDLPILMPGVGAQEGDLATALAAGSGSHPGDLIVSASRSIIYASTEADFGEASRSAVVSLNQLVSESVTS